MTSESNLAVIPARGGSKAIPDKNLRLLDGIPLVAHAIVAARQSRLVDRIVVSTDDERIAAVSRAYGAGVVWRPEFLSGDEAPSEAALLHALAHLEQAEGYRPALLTFLQCTSPLTRPEDIDGTVELLLRRGADCAFTATPFYGFVWEADSSGYMSGSNHTPRFRPRRQNRQPQYLETGAVYVMRARRFREVGHRFFGRTVAFAVPRERALEIDEPGDLLVAGAILEATRARLASRPYLPERQAALLERAG